LQFLGGGDKVTSLITVGTPHQGSVLATFCSASVFLDVCEIIGIDPSSVAVNELRPDSSTLGLLNALRAAPLPRSITYTSIIGTGIITPPVPFTSTLGDGIVSERSQNLASVLDALGRPPIHLQVGATTLIIHTCLPFPYDVIETHTCETSDPGVWTQILHAINTIP
jgi:hypothetical protein